MSFATTFAHKRHSREKNPALRGFSFSQKARYNFYVNESLIIVLLAFVLGVCVGSFLNVLIWRFRTGWGVGGRSHCLSCGKTLSAHELIPLFSFLIQGGKCTHCRAKISWQYPIVELIGGVLTAYIVYRHVAELSQVSGIVSLFLEVSLWWTLLIIAVYDIKHKIIPNQWVGFLALVGLIHASFASLGTIPAWGGNAIFPIIPAWFDFLAGPLIALPFALMWFISDGRWVGLGDAKLMLPLGWFFGIGQAISIFIFAFWIGAIPSIILLLGKKLNMKSEIPFAPFIILAALLVYITGINVLDWTL